MSDRDMRETMVFMEDVRTGTGPMNAAIAVGWSPAKLKRLMQDPGFADLLDVARERRLETVEKTLWELAQGGHFKAIQMVLYNERSEQWRDVRHIQVERHDQLDIGIVVSVKEAALASLREAGVAAFQMAPAVIEATATDADG